MAQVSLEKILHRIAKEEKFISPKFAYSDSPIVGYVASVQKIIITDSESDKKLCLFSKQTPETVQKEYVYFYKNEAVFYNNVIQAFQGISKNNEQKSLIPKCYFANEHFIILEDLFESEYSVWSQLKEPLDSDHVNVILEAYGKFHALSFALKQKDPEKFASIGDRFEWFLENHESLMASGFYKGITENLANCFDEETEFHYIEAIANYCSFGQVDFLQYLHDARENDVYNRGDNWTHNYMFRYDDNKQLKDVSILDFQLFRRTTPIVDLSTFLTVSACTEEVFGSIFDYLKVYHQSLEKHLIALDCPTSVYTWETLKDEWQKYSLKGLMISALVGKMLIADKDEIEQHRRKELPMKWDFVSRNEELYIKRMRIVIKYFYDNEMLTLYK